MKHAADAMRGECRRLGMTSKNERRQLLEMADAGERMAVERERQVDRDSSKEAALQRAAD